MELATETTGSGVVSGIDGTMTAGRGWNISSESSWSARNEVVPSELVTAGTATGVVVTIMAMRSMVPRIRKEYIMSEWMNGSGSTEERPFDWELFEYELEV